MATNYGIWNGYIYYSIHYGMATKDEPPGDKVHWAWKWPLGPHSCEHTHVHTQTCACRHVGPRHSLFHLLPVSLILLCCLLGNFLFPSETQKQVGMPESM